MNRANWQWITKRGSVSRANNCLNLLNELGYDYSRVELPFEPGDSVPGAPVGAPGSVSGTSSGDCVPDALRLRPRLTMGAFRDDGPIEPPESWTFMEGSALDVRLEFHVMGLKNLVDYARDWAPSKQWPSDLKCMCEAVQRAEVPGFSQWDEEWSRRMKRALYALHAVSDEQAFGFRGDFRIHLIDCRMPRVRRGERLTQARHKHHCGLAADIMAGYVRNEAFPMVLTSFRHCYRSVLEEVFLFGDCRHVFIFFCKWGDHKSVAAAAVARHVLEASKGLLLPSGTMYWSQDKIRCNFCCECRCPSDDRNDALAASRQLWADMMKWEKTKIALGDCVPSAR